LKWILKSIQQKRDFIRTFYLHFFVVFFFPVFHRITNFFFHPNPDTKWNLKRICISQLFFAAFEKSDWKGLNGKKREKNLERNILAECFMTPSSNDKLENVMGMGGEFEHTFDDSEKIGKFRKSEN
jgi:hypothetical protein